MLDILRKPLAKVITRAVLYGLTAGLGLEAAQVQEPTEAIGLGVASAIVLIAAALIDRWHHKKDTAK